MAVLHHLAAAQKIKSGRDALAPCGDHLRDFLLRQVGRDLHQRAGAPAHSLGKADEDCCQPVHCVIHRQSVDLRIGLFQCRAENLNQRCDQAGLCHQQAFDVIERNDDRIRILQSNRAIRPLLLGSAKFADHVAALANVVDQFAASGGNGPDFDEASLQKEQCALLVADRVNNLVLGKDRRLTVGKNQITKLSPEHRNERS